MKPLALIQPKGCSTKNTWPPEIVDQVADILADLVLADYEQYPQLLASQAIDSVSKEANTSPRIRTQPKMAVPDRQQEARR